MTALAGSALAQDAVEPGAATPTPTPTSIFNSASGLHGEPLDVLRLHMQAARKNAPTGCRGAREHAREILHHLPDDLEALHVVEECTRAEDHDVGSTTVEFVEKSRILSLLPQMLEAANLREFVPILREVDLSEQESVSDLLMFSELFEKMGEPEKQLRALEQAIAADPNDPRPKLALAAQRFESGDRAGARALYRDYLFKAKKSAADTYLLAYVAALAFPLPALALLLAGIWTLGAIALRRSYDRLAAVYGEEIDVGRLRRIIPLAGAAAPLLLAWQFWVHGKAITFGLLVLTLFGTAAAIVVPPVVRRVAPLLRIARGAVASLFSARFSRAVGKVPTGWRIAIALGTVFLMATFVPTIKGTDIRVGAMVLGALVFWGTVGSLIVTFLHTSRSLHTSLRWIGLAATLPFLGIALFGKWAELAGPLMKMKLPPMHALQDLAFLMGGWCVAVVFAMHLSRILADALVAPVTAIMNNVQKIERGDFGAKSAIVSRDEIGELGQAVNRMSDGLAQREFIKKTFSQYVDPKLAPRIMSGELMVGQRMKAVVLFSDIRGFTRMSEKMQPEQVVTILNDYFEDMVSAIRQQGGVIDKFIGDAIMAHWGVPDPVPDGAVRAVAAALAMRDAMAKISAKFEAQGMPKIGIGIGINLGEVIAGPLGSNDKKEYTVIGDVVNTAQRGEANAMAQQILITESVFREVEAFVDAEALEGRIVKGKAEPVFFWSVKALKAGAGVTAIKSASG